MSEYIKTGIKDSCSKQLLCSWQIKYSFHAYQSSKDSVELRRKQMNDPHWQPPPLYVANVSTGLMSISLTVLFLMQFCSPVCTYCVSSNAFLLMRFLLISHTQTHTQRHSTFFFFVYMLLCGLDKIGKCPKIVFL
jgi:hypothetical protein